MARVETKQTVLQTTFFEPLGLDTEFSKQMTAKESATWEAILGRKVKIPPLPLSQDQVEYLAQFGLEPHYLPQLLEIPENSADVDPEGLIKNFGEKNSKYYSHKVTSPGEDTYILDLFKQGEIANPNPYSGWVVVDTTPRPQLGETWASPIDEMFGIEDRFGMPYSDVAAKVQALGPQLLDSLGLKNASLEVPDVLTWRLLSVIHPKEFVMDSLAPSFPYGKKTRELTSTAALDTGPDAFFRFACGDFGSKVTESNSKGEQKGANDTGVRYIIKLEK